MTFGQLRQALYDRLGFTGQLTLVDRLINEAQQDVAHYAKWPWLGQVGTVTYTANQATVGFPATVRYPLNLTDVSGNALDAVHQDAFEDLFRGDLSTAPVPTAYSLFGAQTDGSPVVYVWPLAATTTTGTSHYLARVTDMTTTTDVSIIPPELHRCIVDCAVVRFRDWEGDYPSAVAAKQIAEMNLKEAAGTEESNVVRSEA